MSVGGTIERPRRLWTLFLALQLVFVGQTSCFDRGTAPVDLADGLEDETEDDPGLQYETLSEYGLFEGNGASQIPADGVYPYEVSVPLFTDYAGKGRFFYLPEGAQIGFSEDERWDFPVGSILIKTFGYPEDLRSPTENVTLIETRLLIHNEDGWAPHTYIWNDEQTEAVREVIGATIDTTWIDLDGEEQNLAYRVPNTNQCHRCHGAPGEAGVLGPQTRQLNRAGSDGEAIENQISHWSELGLLDETVVAVELPAFPATSDEDASVEERMRAYMDSNCSHCHREGGAAGQSGLLLGWEVSNPTTLGLCRIPFAGGAGTGGRLYDVVPGLPDESVMMYRVESTDPDIKMPELPGQLLDPTALELVRQWIEGLEPVGCN